MSVKSVHGGRRGVFVAAAATVMLLGLAAAAIALGLKGASGPPQPPVSAATQPAPSSVVGSSTPTSRPSTAERQGTASVGGFMAASPPVGLDIPSIGVHVHRIVGLHVGADGTLQAPTRFDEVGWYTGGPTPGQFGPAVLGGHVDSRSGPAIFYRLGDLRPGATVKVSRQDGTTASFVIDSIARFAKSNFPTQRVYGNSTGRAEIRLITCGGAFDHASGHYVDNIVAFGHLTA